MSKFGMGVVDRFEDINSSISILNARTVDDKSDQQPDGVCDDMALTAFYLFSRIVAGNSTAFCRFNTLAVNNTGTWTGRTTSQFPRPDDKCLVDPVQHAIVPASRKSNLVL